MSFIKDEEKKIQLLFDNSDYNISSFKLEESNRSEFGMYQYNRAMELAKDYHKNPRDIAKDLVDILSKNKDLININIQGPGFINISFKDSAMVKYIRDVLNDSSVLIDKLDKRKVVLDYGGANVAKTLHVGHLRSANIGEAIKRLAKLCGYEVIGDVHLGDFGRQMGMIILEIKNKYPDLVYFDDNYKGEYPKKSPVTNKDLEVLYPIANNKCKEDINYLNEARKITNKLQKGYPGYVALWRHIVDVSVKDIKRLYDLLGADFDYWYGESNANKYIPELTKYLESINILEKSEGATVIDVSDVNDKKEIPPFIYIKSNETVSYETTDLATIYQREKEFKPDDIWYVVDNRQELHFIQTFRAAYKSKIVSDKVNLEFLGFGTMNGRDGKPFKTRDGGVMTLDNLINLVKEESLKYVKDDINNKEDVALMVGIASLKYADLLSNRSKDYIFDIDKFCDVQGKTGAYLLYSTVRMKSLLDKANVNKYNYVNIYNEYDRSIVVNILNLNKAINNSLRDRSLNELCEYLYKLNNSYNSFYNECKILVSEDKDMRDSWIALTKVVYDINKMLLDVLAIKVPDKM